ncbi:MAG: hypothetical protein AAGF95_11940 [Chloroflexota bacterium]
MKLKAQNIKASEFLYRRVDISDVVSAHILGMHKASTIGFVRYIISATTPFTHSDLSNLRTDAPSFLKQRIAHYEGECARRGWKMFAGIDRVYVNGRARNDLVWQPQYTFETILERLKADQGLLSPLAHAVGAKGYHATQFAEGPYPVE